MDKKNNQISLWFVIIMTALIAGTIYYALIPSDKQVEKKKKLTYEEQVEILNKNKAELEQERANKRYYQSSVNQQYSTQTGKQVDKNQPDFTVLDIDAKPNIRYAQPKKNKTDFYKDLLKYPCKNVNDAQYIVNMINEYNGYPQGIVTVRERNAATAGARIPGSYILGIFDAASGYVYVDTNAMQALPSQSMIPVLAHELDHFDKIIKVCKSMGVENYLNLLRTYNVPGINEDYWRKNVKYADTTGFNSKTYEDALKRLLDRNRIDVLSSYADFYMIAEAIRNPLEISAYSVSDNLEQMYGLNKTEGVMRQLTKEFNKVDWAVYSMAEKDRILRNERIAVFDYLFAQAIMDKYPDTKTVYTNCVKNKNGDLTDFWVMYEKKLPGFYAKNGQLDKDTFYVLLSLLQDTENRTKYGLNKFQYTEALRFKLNTAKSNLVSKGLIEHLQKTALDLLEYMWKEKTISSEDELGCFMVLLCVENNIYKNNHSHISLYELKVPEIINETYKQEGKKQKLNFIYNNGAFKKYCEKKKAINPGLTDQELLINLLEQNALEIKNNR